MKRNLTYICFIDLLFILLLSFSGFFAEPLSSLLYYASFLMPLLVFFLLLRNRKCDYQRIRVTISWENLKLTAPIVMPTVALVFFVSYLTSSILGKFFDAPFVDVSGNLFKVIILHALMPALFEEALFRYVPLTLMSSYSKRGAILVSATLFALIHCNLFQIPYAFFAGVVLASVYVAFNSIIPSFMIHFLNNVLSVLFMRYGASRWFVLWFLISLSIVTAASVVFMVLRKAKYVEKFKPLLSKDGESVKPTADILVLIIITLIISVTNLFY